jgi:2,3-dihydroxybiphenyl 1,2-dioxygenase
MGLQGLGYIGIASPQLDAWRALMVDVLGVGESAGPPAGDQDTLWLQMDDRVWRIAVHNGEREAFAYAGWELAGPDDFAETVEHLQRSGVKLDLGTDALRAARGVLDVAGFDDPFGNRHEVFYGPMVDEGVFVPPHGGGGFVTAGVGLGHVLYVVPSARDALDFFSRIMGFKVTDQFEWGPNGAVFMHTTPRHHSIAYIDLPLPGGPGLNHFMIENTRMEDVGKAYDRAMDAGINIVNSLGQHSNDPMFSFYVESPSGFNVELGWKGLMIDEDNWSVRTYTGRGEMWGHRGMFMDDVAAAKVD